MFWHRHRFVERRRRFTPAITRSFESDSTDRESAMKLIYGFTTIERQCSCGATRTDVLIGNQTDHF